MEELAEETERQPRHAAVGKKKRFEFPPARPYEYDFPSASIPRKVWYRPLDKFDTMRDANGPSINPDGDYTWHLCIVVSFLDEKGNRGFLYSYDNLGNGSKVGWRIASALASARRYLSQLIVAWEGLWDPSPVPRDMIEWRKWFSSKRAEVIRTWTDGEVLDVFALWVPYRTHVPIAAFVPCTDFGIDVKIEEVNDTESDIKADDKIMKVFRGGAFQLEYGTQSGHGWRKISVVEEEVRW